MVIGDNVWRTAEARARVRIQYNKPIKLSIQRVVSLTNFERDLKDSWIFLTFLAAISCRKFFNFKNRRATKATQPLTRTKFSLAAAAEQKPLSDGQSSNFGNLERNREQLNDRIQWTNFEFLIFEIALVGSTHLEAKQKNEFKFECSQFIHKLERNLERKKKFFLSV